MPSINVVDMTGKKVGTVDLAEGIFAIEPNEPAMHTMVVSYLANQRQGTQSALTRSEVSGGGKKPWRQKGTGRARQGSTRAPQWTHGGIVFAPKPRDFSQKLNKKMKVAAIKSALSAKAASDAFVVINNLDIEPKTKNVADMLDSLKLSGRTLIVYAGENGNAVLATRNIPTAEIACVDLLNVYDLVANANFVITVDAVKKLEEVYGE